MVKGIFNQTGPLVLDKLEPSFRLRRIFLVLPIQGRKCHAQPAILLSLQNLCVLLIKLIGRKKLLDARLGSDRVLNVLLRGYVTES